MKLVIYDGSLLNVIYFTLTKKKDNGEQMNTYHSCTIKTGYCSLATNLDGEKRITLDKRIFFVKINTCTLKEQTCDVCRNCDR
jgi:hypothetical protein